MTTRFVFFDLGNVLLYFSHERGARQMAEVAGAQYDAVWQAVHGSGLELRYEAGEISSDDFYREFCARTGTCPDKERLLWAGSAIFEVNVPVKAVASALQSAGHRTGILSNTCASHWSYCTDGRFGGIPDAFDVLALSYRIGAVKPAPANYRAAVEMAGVAAEEVFFVDDKPENVAGARAAGMDAVVYSSAKLLVDELRRRGLRFNY